MLMQKITNQKLTAAAAIAYTEQTEAAIFTAALPGCVWQCGAVEDEDNDMMKSYKFLL